MSKLGCELYNDYTWVNTVIEKEKKLSVAEEIERNLYNNFSYCIPHVYL